MHFGVLIFHEKESDYNSLLNKYYVENAEEYNFCIQVDKDQIENYYKEEIEPVLKKNPTLQKDYKGKSIPIIVKDYCGYEEDEEGNFGYTENPNGKYDWHEKGGRWSNLLPSDISEGDLKKRFRNDLAKFAKAKAKAENITQLNAMLGIGSNQLELSKINIDILKEFFKSVAEKDYKECKGEKNISLNEHIKEFGKVSYMFRNILCADEGWIEGFGEKEFYEKVKEWSEKDGMITIVDCHI